MKLSDEALDRDKRNLKNMEMASCGNGVYLRQGLTDDLFETIADLKAQLAGAVPQEELRALIAKWRTKKWEDDHMAQLDAGVLFFPSHACANEFESLIEKRTVKS